MCYSALVQAEIRTLERVLGAKIDVEWYVRTFWTDRGRDPGKKRPKAPRALELDVLRSGPPEAADAIRAWDAREIAQLEEEVFVQRRRVADAGRALQGRVTKKAEADARIGTAKVAQALARLDELKRPAPSMGPARIYPNMLCPVVVVDGGRRVIRPMRYRCRLPGWTEQVERQYPGTYNARRDNLEKSWGGVFGVSHGVIVATAFYEHVERAGEKAILEFRPDTGRGMLVACLWTRTPESDGGELLSFAVITDEPPAEVAAAGHDRCIVPLKPEHVVAWLDPGGDLRAMHAILDDRERPYFEHREAA